MIGGQHTPGPWQLPEPPYDSVPWLHIYASDGNHIMHADRSDEEKLASARLIAAAPDLLLAVIELEGRFGHVKCLPIDMARAAIAKARGAA